MVTPFIPGFLPAAAPAPAEDKAEPVSLVYEYPQEMLDWAGDEHTLFRSIDWWKQTIGSDPRIASAKFFEMESGDEAWEDWFASGHKYALSDKAAFDKGVGKYMTFIGMAIRRAE